MGRISFRTGDEGVRQAEHFLSVIGDYRNVLLALDFEQNPTAPSMDLEQARDQIGNGKLETYAAQVAEHKRDPYTLVEEIIAGLKNS